MKEEEFKNLKPLEEALEETLNRLSESGEWNQLLKAMQSVSAKLPKEYSLNLSIDLGVFDSDREQELTVYTFGFACMEGEPPFEVSGDSTVHRYIVDGEICQVPHDHCPKCWGIWVFKFLHERCPECDAELGEEVKLLLDSDVCPYCEEGTVTMNQPVCTECGFKVDPNKIVWG